MQQPGSSSTDTTIIGRVIGKYRVIEPIGGGGVSTVYKAYQPDLDRYVALKILSPYHADRAEFARRFVREARAVAALHHPNILPVYDFGEHEGLRYIVMRYVEDSRTLKDEMAYFMSLMRVVDVISQVASALDHAHHHGVIHRDVKPSNILMDGRWALLTDFGLAKTPYESGELTQSGLGVGTPAYMSPEQGQGLPFDHRTDIYSLGVIVYEILTGEVPHNAETPFAIVLRRATEPPEMTCTRYPEVTNEVKAVVLKALAIDPANRFQSAGAFACALRKAVLQCSAESEDESARATRPAFRILPVPTGWLHKRCHPKVLRGDVRRQAAPFGALAIAALSVATTAYLALSSTDWFVPSPSLAQVTVAPPVETPLTQRAISDGTILPSPEPAPPSASTSPAADGVLYRVREDDRERLHMVRVTGEKDIQLTGDLPTVTGAFCGDSTRVLVQAKEGKQTTFYLLNIGDGDQQILAESVDEGWASCSEDGQRVLAAWRRGTDWEAVMFDIKDARHTTLTRAMSALEASWDAQWRVVAILETSGGAYSIRLVDLTSHKLSSLSCDRCTSGLSRPLVSPDARWLLYRACQSATTYALRMVDIENGDTLQLATSFAPPDVSFAPSGDKLLVSIMPVADAPLELHLLDLADGRSVSLLSGEAVGGTFSPDGRWLALWARHADAYHLYVADGEGSSITEVAQSDSYAEWLEFSPDSAWALATLLRDGYYHVYRVSADGAQMQPIVTARQAADWYADAFFSANNDQLLVRLGHSSPQRSSMYLVNLRDGRWTELVHDAEWQPTAAFAADGQYLVFESNRRGQRAIYVADLKRGTIRWLSNGFAPVLGAHHRPAALHHIPSMSSDALAANPCAFLIEEEQRESSHALTPTISIPTSTPTPLPTPRQPTPEMRSTPVPHPSTPETLPSATEITPPLGPSEDAYAVPQPWPTPSNPPVQLPMLALETWVPSSSSAPGQSITLGVRNIWGAPGEAYEFLCTVYAPDGSAASASGVIQGNTWSYLLYPDDFAGAATSTGGDYTMVCTVADQQVTAHFFVDEDIHSATVGDDH